MSLRLIETIDVSRPQASRGIASAAATLGDLALAVLLVLMIPLGLLVVIAPLALVAWAVRALVQLF